MDTKPESPAAPARCPKALRGLAAAALLAALAGARAAAADAASAPERTRHHTPQQAVGSALEDRVRTLAKALDLDAVQQQRLRDVLQAQRLEVQALMHQAALEPADRIVALRMINDQTAERIRALLNDEQRKKYNVPHPHDPEGAPRPDVSALMQAMRPALPAPPPAAR